MADDGADKDFIWMGPEDEADTAESTGAPEDAAPDDGATGASSDQSTWVDDPQQKRTVLIAQISLVILVLIGVAVILAVKSNNDDKSDDKTAQTATDGKTSTDGKSPDGKTTDPKAKPDWPKVVANRPATLGKRGQKAPDVRVTAKPGVYIWNDFDGWHLWAVGGAGMPAKITGSITSSDNIPRADPAVPGAGTASKKDKVASFELSSDKPLSGVDFAPGFFGKRLVIVLDGPDGPVDVALVHLGGGAKPATFPLVIDKIVE